LRSGGCARKIFAFLLSTSTNKINKSTINVWEWESQAAQHAALSAFLIDARLLIAAGRYFDSQLLIVIMLDTKRT